MQTYVIRVIRFVDVEHEAASRRCSDHPDSAMREQIVNELFARLPWDPVLRDSVRFRARGVVRLRE